MNYWKINVTISKRNKKEADCNFIICFFFYIAFKRLFDKAESALESGFGRHKKDT